MDYLLIELWPWMLAALGVGVLTGWLACSRTSDDA
jgi:hypothetical protein